MGTGTTGATGVATVSYTVTDAIGTHVLVTEFAGNATCAASSATKSLIVSGKAARIHVPNVTRGCYETALIGGQLLDAVNGAKLSGRTLEIQIDGTSIGTATTVAGQATVSYTIQTSLGVGDHTITVLFAGDADYAAASNTATLTVTVGATRIDAFYAAVLRQGTVNLKAVLSRLGGYLSGKTLTFKVNGTVVGAATTDSVGAATVAFAGTIPVGTYPLVVQFAGDAAHSPSTGHNTVAVSLEPSWIFVTTRTVEIYQTASLGAQIRPTGRNVRLVGKSIDFSIDGTPVGTAVTDGALSDHAAVLSFRVPDTLTMGIHSVTADFAGDQDIAPSTSTVALAVEKATTKLSTSSATVAAGRSVTLGGALTSAGGPSAGRTLTFKVDGTAVGTATTGADGKATLAYTASIAAGSHTLTVVFSGDSILKATFATTTLTVTP